MSKVIKGTELFGKGAMEIPTGTDFGTAWCLSVNENIERLALHDHSSDGSPIQLPERISFVISPESLGWVKREDSGFWDCTIDLSNGITYDNKVLNFLYRRAQDPNEDNWRFFYPTVARLSDSQIKLEKLPFKMFIKVVQ